MFQISPDILWFMKDFLKNLLKTSSISKGKNRRIRKIPCKKNIDKGLKVSFQMYWVLKYEQRDKSKLHSVWHNLWKNPGAVFYASVLNKVFNALKSDHHFSLQKNPQLNSDYVSSFLGFVECGNGKHQTIELISSSRFSSLHSKQGQKTQWSVDLYLLFSSRELWEQPKAKGGKNC